MLQGAVFTDGINFSNMQKNIDTLCTEEGSCSYEQTTALKNLKLKLKHMLKVIPNGKRI